MDNDNQERERYLRARARVNQLRGFYIHVGVFVVVNLYLLIINLVTNAQSLWFYWPLLAWGVGLAVHGFIVLEQLSRSLSRQAAAAGSPDRACSPAA